MIGLYFDEWQKKWVKCKIIHTGDVLSEWEIIPLEGSLKDKQLFVSSYSVRVNEIC